MDAISYSAFLDEIEKISSIASVAQLAGVKKVLPYVGTAAGTLLAADWLKKQKMKYDIGSQVVKAQERRG